MKLYITIAAICLVACHNEQKGLHGSYRLLESTTIKGADTTFVKVDSTKTEMIKVLNESYFAFFNHDLSKGVDSTALFVSGGGTYAYDGNSYIENLEFCTYRPWEGRQFKFTVKINGDTLTQEGVEDIPELGVKQLIIEKYIKMK